MECCNWAAAKAHGQYIVLLNSDTRVVEGWLDEIIGHFDSFPGAGLVGSKLLNADGTLQEAGEFIGAMVPLGTMDETVILKTHVIVMPPGRFYLRSLNSCSGGTLARDGGFDESFRPAYCEDADLAFRIRNSGRQIWYQPLSRVVHYEGMTHGRDERVGGKAHQVVNLKRLQARWSGRLPGVRRGGEYPDLEANRSTVKRMLVIDADIHRPDRDAGSFIASEMMRAYRSIGFDQSFVSLDNMTFDSIHTPRYQRLGVAVWYRPWIRTFEDVLEKNEAFDYVLIFRFGVAHQCLEVIRKVSPTARVIFSNVDLHFLRLEREALLRNDRSIEVHASRTKTHELSVIMQVDSVIVHTPEEKSLIRSCCRTRQDNITVLPWVIDLVTSEGDLGLRQNVMFLGGFRHKPNVDAVEYFVREVWPLVDNMLDPGVKFVVVGADPPEQIKGLASDRIVVTGYVEEVASHFERARCFVAPLRFGAGIKGKVIQSLAHGVPTIATSIASEGIGLTDGEHYILADSPQALRRQFCGSL